MSNAVVQLAAVTRQNRLLATAVTTNTAEIGVTVQITFLHDEPDLIREVPAIPG